MSINDKLDNIIDNITEHDLAKITTPAKMKVIRQPNGFLNTTTSVKKIKTKKKQGIE